MNNWWIIGGAGLAGWLLITRRMTPEEVRRSRAVGPVSLAVLGGLGWFFYYVMVTHCHGTC
jgi:hypothetical protein